MHTKIAQRAKALSLDDPIEAARKYLEGVVLDTR